jgi:hypothetical protein
MELLIEKSVESQVYFLVAHVDNGCAMNEIDTITITANMPVLR